jgi:hypothetical protein
VEWERIVAAESADHFPPATHHDLAQLCRHIVNARRVAMLVEEMCRPDASNPDGDLDVVKYDRLLKMQERETRAILSASTKLRISNQARYDKSKKRPVQTAKKPWQA